MSHPDNIAQRLGIPEITNRAESTLTRLEHLYRQSDANVSAAAFLRATGCPLFYPPGEKGDNYAQVTSGDPILSDPEVLTYIIYEYIGNKDNRRAARLAASAIGTVVYGHLTPYDVLIDKDRESSTFWDREIAPLQNGKDIVRLVEQEDGETPWDKYNKIRNRLTGGSLPPEDITQYVAVFDAVERAAGKQEAEQLVRAVRKIKELGFSKLDQYFELVLGEPVEAAQNRVTIMLAKFMQSTDKSSEQQNYFVALAGLMNGYDNFQIPQDIEAATLDGIEALGISKNEWDRIVVTCPDAMSFISTAYYFLIPGTPDFQDSEGLDPAKEKWPNGFVWERIMGGARVGIAARAQHITQSEQVRLFLHEKGHGVEGVLKAKVDTDSGDEPASSLLSRPVTLNEVFSLLNESKMPDRAFFNRKEGFLTHRYAALLLHEITLWKEAERVADGEITMEEYLNLAEASYQQTVGDSLHLQVSTARAFRDFLNQSNPFVASSYAFGMPLALAVDRQLQTIEAPDDKRAFLEKISNATAQGKNVDAVLEALGLTWEQAIDCLDDLKT